MTLGDLNALFAKANEFAFGKITEVFKQREDWYQKSIAEKQEDYDKQLKVLSDRIAEKENEVKIARQERDEHNTKLIQSRQQSEIEISDLKKQVASLTKTIEFLEDTYDVKNKRLKEAKANADRLLMQAKKASEQVEQLEKEISNAE